MQTMYELGALSNAKNYQKWMYHSIERYMGKRILELGSGIGNLSCWLPQNELLVLSDVEKPYIDHLSSIPSLNNPKVKIIQMDLSRPIVDQVSSFDLDTVVSFNVMEHIEDDFGSIAEQVKILKQSRSKNKKRVVIFAPAFQIAFGELDREFKHYRRYRAGDFKRMFKKIDPSIKVHCRYFNLLSFVPWIIQGRILKTNRIKDEQVSAFEKILPFWKPVDYLLTDFMRLPLGQSVICVAEI